MLFTFPGRQVNLAEKVSERLEEIVGMAKLKEQILKWTKSVLLDRKRAESGNLFHTNGDHQPFIREILELGKQR